MFVLTHNGYKIEFFDTAEQVEAYIEKTVSEYKELCPKEIFRAYGTDNQAEAQSRTGTIKSIIVWQYSTLYTEVFMIEER